MKDKLIEKDRKFYKECGVVMLETAKDTLLFTSGKKLNLAGYPKTKFVTGKHLYITSDDEVKEGDWCINPNGYPEIFGYDFRAVYTREEMSSCKKIIASTDPKLTVDKKEVTFGVPSIDKGLPSPSDKFIQTYIEAYNQGEKIKKVLVEYEQSKECECHTSRDCISFKLPSNKHCSRFESKYYLRLKDNNVIIKKAKDSWSREEVIKLLQKYETDTLYFGRDSYYKGVDITGKWIEENL